MRTFMRQLARRAASRADKTLVAAALLLWGLGAAVEDPPPRPPFLEEHVRIPAHAGRYTLAATIVRPRGLGPYGAIVLNHGVPATPRARAAESSAPFLPTAAALAARDYVVLMPMRRGFGATGGPFAEDSGMCSDPDYRRGERAAVADVLAAYHFVRRLPYVDASRIMLAGQSAGGIVALSTAAQSPPGLVAVLAFAAGRGGDPARAGVPCAGAALADMLEDAARTIRAPVLLHYARNDLYFGPAASRSWFQRIKAGGANAEYVLQPPFGRDGHFVFGPKAGIGVWLPVVERFLSRHGVPFGAQSRTL